MTSAVAFDVLMVEARPHLQVRGAVKQPSAVRYHGSLVPLMPAVHQL